MSECTSIHLIVFKVLLQAASLMASLGEGQMYSFERTTSCIPDDAHGVVREVWYNIPSGALIQLKQDPRYPGNPSTSESVQTMEAPRGYGANYGQKLSAYFIAPETGGYVFYMSCDDQCELWVSGNESNVHARAIITISQWTKYRDWDSLGDIQRSTAMQMTAGGLYYMEALMVQGGGMEHLSVGARFPSGLYNRPLSSDYLLRYAPGSYGMSSRVQWGQWSSCSVSCGGGFQVRNRTCLKPLPIFSGVNQTANKTESRACLHNHPCPAPPRQISARTTNPSAITVTWLPYQLKLFPAKITNYKVFYKSLKVSKRQKRRRDASRETNTMVYHVIRQDNGHVLVPASYQSVVLNGLRVFTKYCIQITTLTTAWESERSACVNITTAEDVPSLPPSNVGATNLTSSHKTHVTWSTVPPSGQHGHILGYIIKVHLLTTTNLKHDKPTEWTVVTMAPHLREELTGLETFAVYSVQVAAFTSKGNGPFSKPAYTETCRCPKTLFTNWWILPPLTMNHGERSTGIFQTLLPKIIDLACGECNGHRYANLIALHDPNTTHLTSPIKTNQLRVKQNISTATHLSFPLSAEKGGQVPGHGYRFVPVVEVLSAVVYVKRKLSSDVYAKMVGSTVFTCWPSIILLMVMTLLAGTILCILEAFSFPQQVSHTSFLSEVYEYTWCAFVSVTSVGYGDRIPRTIQGRLFTIAWFLVGHIVILIFVASLASSLSVKVLVLAKNPVQGGKIGVLERTVEFRVASKMNGTQGTQCISYPNLEKMLTALKEHHIDGILLDVLSTNNLDESTLPSDTFSVAKAFDVTLSYGVGLSGDAIKLENSFNKYVEENPVSLEDRKEFENLGKQEKIADSPLDSTSSPQKIEDKQISFFDPNSKMYSMALRFVSGLLIGFIFVGILFTIICRETTKPEKTTKKGLDVCTKHIVIRSKQIHDELRDILEHFYRSCLVLDHQLKLKHKQQQRQLLQQLRQQGTHRYHLVPKITHHRLFEEKPPPSPRIEKSVNQDKYRLPLPITAEMYRKSQHDIYHSPRTEHNREFKERCLISPSLGNRRGLEGFDSWSKETKL